MSERAASSKSADAYRTISEVADDLGLPQHVLRFWETRFPQVKPLKRAGGRRFYRPEDVQLLRAVKALLYDDGYTIKGVQRMLRDEGSKAITALAAMPSSAAQGGSDDAPTSPGVATGNFPDEGAVPTMLSGNAASTERHASKIDRDSLRSTPDPTFRTAMDLPTDVVGRLQTVLHELAECKLLVEQAHPSLIR